ncbi:M28 family peptidase [bacterium]|nr:M28 family peptidase [Candidatus Elulimicrobium humile]
MNIKETFLGLTTRTYPHGTESDLFHLLPDNLETDEFGNRYIQIGENPSCMFTSHLDTATSARTDVNHVIDGDIIRTDGKSILGADDKAGVTVMLYMIQKNIPGLYYFFLGEEVGCVGSKKLANKHKVYPIPNIKKVISFDRRGTSSVITFQQSSRCCSETFGDALSKALNEAGLKVEDNDTVFDFSNDPTGIYTDSAVFMSIYPECTNISVGYQSEHTYSESQNIKHLDKLAKACEFVSWDELPVERDPSKVEYREYAGSYYSRSYGGGAWGDDDYYTYSSPVKKDVSYEEKIWFIDEEFENFVSFVTINKWTKKLLNVDLSQSRLDYEQDLICQLLMSLEVDFEEMTWDGFTLRVIHKQENGGHTSHCDRNDLTEYIDELMFWKELSEKDYKDDGVNDTSEFLF